MGRHKSIGDEQLLRHAREVFLERGASGSTKEIARRAGLSEATLFQRFPTKAVLFLAAMVPPKVDAEGIVHAPTRRKDPRGALTEIGSRMFAYFRTLIPTVMHLLAHPSIRMEDVATHFRQNPSLVLTEALAGYLREGAVRGELKADNPSAAAGLLVAAIHSLAAFEVMEMHGGRDMEHAVPLFVAALWGGLDPKKPAGTRLSRPRKKRGGASGK